ncbi:hypothetical protein Droror1_Dr00023667 [Drosera rotundifolia]
MSLPCQMHHPNLYEATMIRNSSIIMYQAKVTIISAANLDHHNKRASSFVVHGRNPPKYLRYPRRAKVPPESGPIIFSKGDEVKSLNKPELDNVHEVESEQMEGSPAVHDNGDLADEGDEQVSWDADELEAISSLFQGRIPQRPGKVNRERPLPLPLPHKLRPLGLPTPKRHLRSTSSDSTSSRAMLSNRVYKDPVFLINLAREIRNLPEEYSVVSVLNKCSRFLRKGSLSLTVRELGHMGFPERALQTFSWAQKQPHLFPDDRILASIVEILGKTRLTKFPSNWEKFVELSSRPVLEAMATGLILGGSLNVALGLVRSAEKANRILATRIYVKLIREFTKNPDTWIFATSLLEQLAGRDDLELNQQDCISLMKACVRLERYQVAEKLFEWFKLSGNTPRVAMYSTVIKSCYLGKKYREALALVWEMEASDCVFDLTAYRVVIKLLVALNDLSRTVKYFSKLKEAGFSPSYDIYRNVVQIYLISGRLVKCKEVCKELESSGFMLDEQLSSQLLQLERNVYSGV